MSQQRCDRRCSALAFSGQRGPYPPLEGRRDGFAARKGLARRIQAVFPGWKNIRQVSGSAQLMISNDTAYVPALVVTNPGWRGQYDQDQAVAEASRRALLDRVIADKIMICGYHFRSPAPARSPGMAPDMRSPPWAREVGAHPSSGDRKETS